MIEETYKYLADAYKNIQIFPTDSSDTLKDQWQTVEQKKTGSGNHAAVTRICNSIRAESAVSV